MTTRGPFFRVLNSVLIAVLIGANGNEHTVFGSIQPVFGRFGQGQGGRPVCSLTAYPCFRQ